MRQSHAYEVPSIYGDSDEYRRSGKEKCLTCAKWSSICLVSTFLILFILIFIILPLVVMWSIDVQRFLVFLNIDQPKNPQYTNYKLYGADGTRNSYIDVHDLYNEKDIIKLGTWHLVPEALLSSTDRNDFDYDKSIENSDHDVVIYCHGQIATRIEALPTYKVLRKYFHVITPDYRSFGDSTAAELTEDAVVYDMVQFVKIIKAKTKKNLYIWGHSLGTGICTHTVAKLKEENIIPMGLMLEAPFSNLRDAIPVSAIGKIFSWLPWFSAISDAIEDNGFRFESTKNIQNVDCPIMIMHAEDDGMIPYYLGKKLADTAIKEREQNQGNVTYYQFAANLGYNHVGIHKDPELPKFIENFKEICRQYKKGT